jgi:hypothetical protein
MKKKSGKYNLLEAIDFINKENISESTFSHEYPDNGTGISSSDDTAPSNGLLAPRYKQVPYYNRLTPFDKNWDHDESDWHWDKFEYAKGQGDFDNFSQTIWDMKKLFPKETWNTVVKHMQNYSDKSTEKYMNKLGKVTHDVSNQLGKDIEPHVEVDIENGSKFKGVKMKNEDILNKIDDFLL